MKKSTIYLIAGYALILVGGFIGAPKMSLSTAAIALAIFTALYFGGVYFVKTFRAK